MQTAAHRNEALKALGVVLRGIELFGKEQSFLPCQRLFLNSLLWRDSVHFLQERGCVVIENRKGTFVSPKFKTLDGLRLHLEEHFGLSSASCALPDIRPNYPLRVPHPGPSTDERGASSSAGSSRKSLSPQATDLLQKALAAYDNPTFEQVSRVARNLNLPESQVYGFVNRQRSKRRRTSYPDLTRPPSRHSSLHRNRSRVADSDNEANSSGSDSGAEISFSDVQSDDSPARKNRKIAIQREVEQMLSVVYASEDVSSTVEVSCVNILANIARIREAEDGEDFDLFGDRPAPKRHRVTRKELETLERIFAQTSGYPDTDVFDRVSSDLGWDVGKVKKWFQNQRQRQKDRRSDASEGDTREYWTDWRDETASRSGGLLNASASAMQLPAHAHVNLPHLSSFGVKAHELMA